MFNTVVATLAFLFLRWESPKGAATCPLSPIAPLPTGDSCFLVGGEVTFDFEQVVLRSEGPPGGTTQSYCYCAGVRAPLVHDGRARADERRLRRHDRHPRPDRVRARPRTRRTPTPRTFHEVHC